ncbi:unnamed protein product [Paramecium pentaurelia]|uniref:Uncharacterized protein n=1 Tax=Paramecium pentaurelia TaxID=43138 RepID=A0A8S1TYX2_9CILI|nr:unnamed protein product [Paramecium pentaurelia]
MIWSIIKKEYQRNLNFFAHSLNRLTIGIWRCSQTGLQIVSEALKVNTHAGLFAKQGMLRIKKLKDDVEVDFKEQKKSRKSQQINQRSKENLILKSLRKQQ